MSLTVQQLNPDTTFLLTFSPPFAPSKLAKRFPGDFTILVDPWLKGSSSILHPSFQLSHHTAESAVRSLAELKRLPDLIIVSQDKPDHCHKESLCSLPKDVGVAILATPAAARKIQGWKHFDASQVHALKAYNAASPDTVVRIRLPAYSSASAAGEITIVNVPAKHDMTGLHNAIGITYQPPSTILSLSTQYNRHAAKSTVQLSEHGISAAPMAERPRTAGSNPRPPFLDPLGKSNTIPDPPPMPMSTEAPETLSRPHSRADSGIGRISSDRSKRSRNREQIVSVIYTPHGLPPRILQPYIQNHLRPLHALPVSALFHSMNMETNPWFMGGVVATGAPGGIEIVKKIGGVSHWISAHDEVKDNTGIATVWIKSRQYALQEVQDMLSENGHEGTKVHRLGVGETVRMTERQEQSEMKREPHGGLKGHKMDVDNEVLAVPKPPVPTTNGITHRDFASTTATTARSVKNR